MRCLSRAGRFVALAGVVCLGSLGLNSLPAADDVGADRSPASLFPTSTVFFAELREAAAVVKLIAEHPLADRTLALEPVREALQKKESKEFFKQLKDLEGTLGLSSREILSQLSHGGVAIGFEPGSMGVVLVMKAESAEALDKIHSAAIDQAKQIAENFGAFEVFEISDYRGYTTYRVKESIHAVVGQWLIMTNKTGLGRTVVDKLLDKESSSLATDPLFQQARQQVAADSTAWAYGRLDLLRTLGLTKKLFPAKSDNPGAEFLVGGVLATLADAPYVTAAAKLTREELQVTLASPYQPSKIPAARQFFFAPAGQPGAPAVWNPPGTLLSLTTYRDLAKLWTAADELFDEKMVAELAKVDSQLTLFFSGRDFSTEILGKFEPRLQFLLAGQDFANSKLPVPDLKLPAGALILETTPDAELAKPLKIAFQSIIGLSNLNAGQEGRPQLELQNRREGDLELTYATYDTPAADAKEEPVPIVYNFSPTLAVRGRQVILSSTLGLAEELLRTPDSKLKARTNDNLLFEVQPLALANALRENREPLVAQNMLEKGHSRDKAEFEVGLLLQLIEGLDRLAVRLVPSADQLQLQFQLKLAPLDKPASTTKTSAK